MPWHADILFRSTPLPNESPKKQNKNQNNKRASHQPLLDQNSKLNIISKNVGRHWSLLPWNPTCLSLPVGPLLSPAVCQWRCAVMSSLPALRVDEFVRLDQLRPITAESPKQWKNVWHARPRHSFWFHPLAQRISEKIKTKIKTIHVQATNRFWTRTAN